MRTYAFDGDNAYQSLHGLNFQNYFSTLFKRKNAFDVLINLRRIVGDPLHLFKRLRYRLFKNIIRGGFLLNSPFIDAKKLRIVLQ